jgi:hypothetical protein
VKSYTVLPLAASPGSPPTFLYYNAHTPDAQTTLFVANQPALRGVPPAEVAEGVFRLLLETLCLPSDLSVSSATVLQSLDSDLVPPSFPALKRAVHESQANTTASLLLLHEEAQPSAEAGKYAKVTFTGSTKPLLSLSKSLKAASKKRPLPSPFLLDVASLPPPPPSNPLKHLAASYLSSRPPPPARLKALADQVLSSYASLEASWSAAAAGPQVDADGWETVTHKSGKPDVARAVEASRGGRRAGEKRARGNKAKNVATTFYRFQVRDRKRAKVGELKDAFERDRERVRKIQGEGGLRAFK